MEEENKYIDNLEVDISTMDSIDNVLKEYESGNINRDQLIALIFLGSCKSYTNGYQECARYIFNENEK
jgi:hypothetical protein